MSKPIMKRIADMDRGTIYTTGDDMLFIRGKERQLPNTFWSWYVNVHHPVEIQCDGSTKFEVIGRIGENGRRVEVGE